MAAIARIEAEADPEVAAARAAAAEAQDDTDITHCRLDFEVQVTSLSPSVTGTITGSNTLNVTSLVAGLTQMTLDLDSSMSVTAVTVNGTAATYSRPTDQIVINLGATYNAGATFQVKINYNGTPIDHDSWDSPFFTTHPRPPASGQPIFSTLSQPYFAHRWWPCKENWAQSSIADKFTMETWVTVPNTMIVASNGLLQGTDPLSGSRLRYRWKEDYPIATYLVSVAATNYTKQVHTYNYPGGSMPVEFYIFSEHVSAATPYLANIVQGIATFSEYYGQYPFINEKYGIAQFPWCCGMEHQTMTSQGAYTSETRNIHELSHMWWGDNVTCKTWHNIWLNEGFAIFSNAFWHEKKPGGSYAESLSYLNNLNTGSYPIKTGTGTVYRYNTSASSNIFSTTYSYNKAGWVVHMLRHVLGDATFFNCLAAWRDAYGGSAGDTEDFRAICETTAGLAPGALAWFFDQWIYNPGSLYYRYGWEQEQINGRNWVRLHVEQRQKVEINSAFPNAMKMPVNITINTASGSQTHVIWNDATGAGSTVTEWFLLPASGPVTGVQFDKDTWPRRR